MTSILPSVVSSEPDSVHAHRSGSDVDVKCSLNRICTSYKVDLCSTVIFLLLFSLSRLSHPRSSLRNWESSM